MPGGLAQVSAHPAQGTERSSWGRAGEWLLSDWKRHRDLTERPQRSALEREEGKKERREGVRERKKETRKWIH